MIFKRFRINCVLRVLLISATIYLLFFLLLQTEFYAATLIVGLMAVYQIYSLIFYVEKTNRDLARFLDAVKHADFSQSFSSAGLGSSFDNVKAAFNEVMDRFREARAEKEEHYRYLQTVVQHIGIGLLAFDKDGDVELINTATKRLLRVPYLRNIKALERFSKPLVEALREMKSGDRNLVRVTDDSEILQLAMYATEFRMREQNFTLVSIQNIHTELEEKEMEAWQNLIRVLTHEIMNSITPIASLASTANELLENLNGSDGSQEEQTEMLHDIGGALQTIEKRSQGLLHFVDAYRNLTRIPKPKFQIFPVAELFDRLRQLMQASLDESEVELAISITPPSLELTGDPELIEQVLINLVVNAIQANQQRRGAKVMLRARIDERSRVVLEIEDNGPGIMQEVQEKIFIPFFTTKQGGSGIGLSLSRQIMRLHRGSITLHSEPDVRTVFILRF